MFIQCTENDDYNTVDRGVDIGDNAWYRASDAPEPVPRTVI